MFSIILRTLSKLLFLFIVACPAFVCAQEFMLSDGRKIVLTNKTCSDCPDPSIKLVGKDDKVIAAFPAKEKELIISTIVMDDGKYLVTATTGGEGVIRVYDIEKRAMIYKVQPFGTAKTWGKLYDLGNHEFAILSTPSYTYLKPKPEFSRLNIYSIINGKVKETGVKRLAKIPDDTKQLLPLSNGSVFRFIGRNIVTDIRRSGEVVRTISFDKGTDITDTKSESSDVMLLTASLYSKYFVIRIDENTVKFAVVRELPCKYEGMNFVSMDYGVKFDSASGTKIKISSFREKAESYIELSDISLHEIPVLKQADNWSLKVGDYDKDGNLVYKGIFIWKQGDRYEGDFVKTAVNAGDIYIAGKRTGKGKYNWPNGDRYEGDFVDGARTGQGIYRWANGKMQSGEFVNGVFQR